jgi:chromosomal replication initiation ATPase DnaA
MNQETNNISNVLLELNKTIQVIGKDKLLELLKISRENESNLNEEIKYKSQEVIKIVCGEFNIDVDDFYSRTRKNNRRYAIGITAMILKEYLNLDIADISFLLKKPNNLVSIYCTEVYELNPRHKSDIYIIERIENINQKLKLNNNG